MNDLSALLPSSLQTNDGKKYSWRAYLLIVIFCLAHFLPGISSIPPIDRDEPRFAQATKQMIESGNYVDIRFQNETRYKKPIGIYWLQAASVKLLNPLRLNEIWAYRIPSLIGATVAVVITAQLGFLMFNPITGLLAALLMASCMILNVEARLAKTDAILLACTLAAEYGLAKAYLLRHSNPTELGWPSILAFWTAQSLGFLIKGPLLLLITLGTTLALRTFDKKKNAAWLISLKPLIGLLFMLLTVSPWFIVIMAASHGEFVSQSIGHDFLAKIWQGQDRGALPPGLHMLVFPLVFFPGSILAMLALPDIWANRKDDHLLFCLSWIIPTWIAFELSLTKLPHYVLPTYPTIALLAAYFATKGFPAFRNQQNRIILWAAFCFWLIAGASVAIALTYVPILLTKEINVFGVISGILMFFWVTYFLLAYKKQSLHQLTVLFVGSLLASIIAFGFTLPSLKNVWLSREIVQIAAQVNLCPTLSLASSAFNEPSLIFLAGTRTKVDNVGGEIAQSLRKDSCTLGVIDNRHENEFLESFRTDAIKPVELARIAGFNIGSGRKTELTLYRLPKQDASDK